MFTFKRAVLGCAISTLMLGAGQTAAADLGVVTSLDICNALGRTGLNVGSGSNCLTISGEVQYSFTWGDYNEDHVHIDDLEYSGDSDIFIGNGVLDWESTAEFWLQFDALSASDFGSAAGVVKIEGTRETVFEDLALDDETDEIVIDEAFVSIGDATVLSAGIKDTIAETSNDTSFTLQEMFNEDEASGVGFNSDRTRTDIDTAGHVIHILSDLGNGFEVRGGLENLDHDGTIVGALIYEGDDLDAHVTVLADEVLTGLVNDWALHAGVTVGFENFRVRGAVAANNDGWWNVLGTADAELDIFTLAIGAEATSENEFGLAGSVVAEVADGVAINLGSRAFREEDNDLTIDTVLEGEVALGETITLIAGGGYVYESDDPVGLTYGRLSLEWVPGDEIESELTGRVHSRPGSELGYEVVLTATKSFQ